MKILLGSVKDESIRSCIEINKKIKSSKLINFVNLLLLPDIYNSNKSLINYVSELVTIDNINLTNYNEIEKKCDKINKNISYSTNNKINNTLSSTLLNRNTSIIIINSLYLKTTWMVGFSKLIKNVKFYGNIEKNIIMMEQNNIIHNYFEDNINCIIEMEMCDDLAMGIILSKKGDTKITSERYNYYILQLKPILFRTVKIPKFIGKSKFKINGILKKLGLNDIFINANLSNIVKNDTLKISDIIHDIRIDINEQGINKNNNRQYIEKKESFIANYPFIYYIRYKPLNTILLIGEYN